MGSVVSFNKNGCVAGVLAVLACLAANASTAPVSIADLPLYDQEAVRCEGDWLVTAPETGAALYRTEHSDEIVLSNGLISRVFRLAPNGATVAFDNLSTGEAVIRGVKAEARIVIDGKPLDVGGLKGQPNYAFLRSEWVDALTADPAALQFEGFETGLLVERMAWNRVRHHAPDAEWPPKGGHLRMDYRMPNAAAGGEPFPKIRVSVHYELYDGVPILSKWLTVRNEDDRALRLDSFTTEILAAVERGSDVDSSHLPLLLPNIHVESDYAFQGGTAIGSSRFAVHWVPDPDYSTQVNYSCVTPCLLEVRPEMGPAVDIAPGETFESFRAFVMPYDSYDRERKGLAQRRMYRTIAPWVTENPLMMHVRYADWDAVKLAIDQCAEVGFELVIMTFGSGFNIEDDSEQYLAEMTRYADYAASRGIEIGGYSLLASRSIDAENDVVMPEGQIPTFGHSPCLLSEWGMDYFRKLYQFYDTTGMRLLEHDGSYPGDVCMSGVHPGHRGLEDSRWKQWREISDFYKWCRGTGVYLNVPDYYYLAGSNKCGMGYREVNWSLPRAQQVLHTRQNIYDGTWEKTPSMGWMFVPLTEYHGGGAAATIEPLDEHLEHYERMITSNLAMGVQACYRGPRLYDTDRTKAMVVRWVAWFKEYRDILESDLVHGRRADGRDIDWMLHVNPNLERKGMLVVFNPLEETVERTISPNLYYTGLTEKAFVAEGDAPAKEYALHRDYTIELPVSVPPKGFAWFVITGG